MKKIAINFSGAIRTFEYCMESININIINELKKEYEVYTFGHFWILKEDKDFEYDMKWKKDCENSISKIKNYGFVDLSIEEYNKEWETHIIKECDGSSILEKYDKIENIEERQNYKSYAVNCMGMYFKILECHKLIEKYENKNGIEFDYIIRIRPDFYWNEKIPLELIPKLCNNEILLVRDSYCIRAKWMGNDKFFMGTRNMMNNYCQAYKKIKYFFEKNVRVEGQNIAKSMIEDMNLNIVFFGSDKTYDKATGKFIKLLSKKK